MLHLVLDLSFNLALLSLGLGLSLSFFAFQVPLVSTQFDKTKWVRFKSKPKVRLGLLLVSTRESLDPITNLLSNFTTRARRQGGDRSVRQVLRTCPRADC